MFSNRIREELISISFSPLNEAVLESNSRMDLESDSRSSE